MIKKIQAALLLLLLVFLIACSSKTKSGNLDEKAIKATSAKAIDLIKEKKYDQFKELFAPEIVKDIPDAQLNKLVDQINDFLGRKEFPDKENIVFEADSSVLNQTPILINNIIYKFDNPNHSLHSYSRAITFSFMPKYGTDKLCGVHLTDDKPYP